jgi:hypothetical protein
MIRRKTDADMALDLARLAQLFLTYGRPGAADRLLNAALELDASNLTVQRVRAFTAYKCGRYAEAVELARAVRTGTAAATADPAAATVPERSRQDGLAVIGLSLVEAYSLIALGRTGDARHSYASLQPAGSAGAVFGPPDQSFDAGRPSTVPADRKPVDPSPSPELKSTSGLGPIAVRIQQRSPNDSGT